MIKKFNDYDSIQVNDGNFKSIVPGGYICKVVSARVEDFSSCSILKVAFDIVEGEFAQYYTQRFNYAKSQNPNAKWGGVFDVFIPKDDGSEKDGYTKQAFKRFTTSIERSNQGYVWNWDENTLKGKLFGGIFGREQFKAQDGSLKFATKCRFANSVDTIRKGEFKIPQDKLLKVDYNAAAQLYNQWGIAPHDDDDDVQVPPRPDSIPPQYYPQQNTEIGDLSDFEEILNDGQMPF